MPPQGRVAIRLLMRDERSNKDGLAGTRRRRRTPKVYVTHFIIYFTWANLTGSDSGTFAHNQHT